MWEGELAADPGERGTANGSSQPRMKLAGVCVQGLYVRQAHRVTAHRVQDYVTRTTGPAACCHDASHGGGRTFILPELQVGC